MKVTAHEFLYAFQSIKPQSSSSAALSGSVADILGFDECLVMLDAGVATGAASTVVSIRASANSDGSSDAALSGTSFTAITSSNHNAMYVGRIDLAKLDPATQRYIFAKGVGDGANAQVYAVSFVFLNYKYRPINGVSMSPNAMSTQTAVWSI